MTAEWSRLKAGERKQVNLADAKPVLETVIDRWEDVPRQERRELFEAFASYATISKVTRHTKTITIHWRDGSNTIESTTHRSIGYFWDEEDLDRLKGMFDADADQIDILRAFPDYPWRSLTQRMRYHYGKGWWKSYQGKKNYPRDARWEDTEEAAVASAAEAAAFTAEADTEAEGVLVGVVQQPMLSYPSTDTAPTRQQVVPFDLSDVARAFEGGLASRFVYLGAPSDTDGSSDEDASPTTSIEEDQNA